jgi:hypothetical protein
LVRVQVLDGQEAVPRLLKFRSGHSAPPVVVRHYADVSGDVFGASTAGQHRGVSPDHPQTAAAAPPGLSWRAILRRHPKLCWLLCLWLPPLRSIVSLHTNNPPAATVNYVAYCRACACCLQELTAASVCSAPSRTSRAAS